MIDKKYLEAMEKDQWHKLPGEIYAKNFLKKYCEFLALDTQQLQLDWQKIPCFKLKDYQQDFNKKTNSQDFFNLPKTLKITLISIIICALLIYFVWQINQFIKAPEIILYHPITDLTLSEKTLTISGKTESEVNLKINNENIVLDKNNEFFQTLTLQPGLNTLKIEGKKKYSKTRIIERNIILETTN